MARKNAKDEGWVRVPHIVSPARARPPADLLELSSNYMIILFLRRAWCALTPRAGRNPRAKNEKYMFSEHELHVLGGECTFCACPRAWQVAMAPVPCGTSSKRRRNTNGALIERKSP